MLILVILPVVLGAAPPRYQYSYYNEGLGLSRTIVQDFDQDRSGCLWMATWSGLYRYDGKRFSNYRPESPDAQGRQPNIRFDRVCTDAFGRLWALSYDKVLYRFDLHREAFERVNCGKGISAIWRLSSDDFRLLASDGTLLRIRFSDMGRNYHIEEYMKLDPGETVNDIRKDAGDNVWVLTDRALYLNRTRAAERPAYCYEETDEGAVYIGSSGGVIVEYINGRFFELDTRSGKNISVICRIPGTLKFLLGSISGGFSVLSLEGWKLTPVKGSPYFVHATRYLRDSGGNIWIYSPDGSICLFDPEGPSLESFYCTESGANVWDTESNVRCAFLDRQDNVWIGGSWGGVGKAVLREYKFSLTPMDAEAGGEAGSVRSLMQSSSGIIYAGTKGGRVHLLDRGLHPLTSWDAGKKVYSIIEDSEGRIWLGTKGTGVIENAVSDDTGLPAFRPRRYVESPDRAASGSKLVYCIRQSGDRLWIASFDGSLAYCERKGRRRRTFTAASAMPGFPSEELSAVRHIAFAPDGKMLICGINGIYSCDNPGDRAELLRFEKFGDVDRYDIQHILITSGGTVYASSFGKGFLQFEGRSVTKAWTSADGLLSDFVLSAVEDRSGNIWIVTYKGLNKLNPASGTVTGWSYDRIGHDFLFNEGEPLLTDDGRILLNTTDGILSFNPEEIANSSYTPKVFVRACYVSGERTFLNGGRLKMHSRDRLIVYFSAPDLSSPESIICSWRLDGGEWTRLGAGSSPIIDIERLKPGRHSIEMKSTNADGADAGNGIRMEIAVWPEPHWMIIAALLLFIGIAAATNRLIHRRRLREAGIGAEADAVPAPEEEEDRLNEEERRFRDAFLGCLEKNLDNGELSAEDIAAALGISRSVLFDKCRSVLGKAPTEYLRELRFEKAAEMVKEGSRPISEVAYLCGFNDAHYFSKAFRKRYGMTPSEYRRSA